MPSWRSRTSCWSPTFPTIPISRASFSAISPVRSPSNSPTRSATTGCAARSSPPSSPIRSSIAAGRSSWCGSRTRPARPPASIATAFAAVRDSYGMTALNTEIDGLDNKIAGSLQLDLYAAVQRLLRDRVVWFLRNVDLTKGLAGLVDALSRRHRRGGRGARRRADGRRRWPRATTASRNWSAAGVPADLARRLASLPALTAAPDIVLVAERTGQEDRRRDRDLFRGRSRSSSSTASRGRRGRSGCRTISTGWRSTARSIRSATPSGGMTAAMTADGAAGAAAVEAWVAHADGRRPAHPRGGARNREFGVDAVEAVGRRQPARRSGQAVAVTSR